MVASQMGEFRFVSSASVIRRRSKGRSVSRREGRLDVNDHDSMQKIVIALDIKTTQPKFDAHPSIIISYFPVVLLSPPGPFVT